MLPAVSWRYYQKVHSKLSIRDRMQIKRTFGVTPGCIPDPKKGYRRFERWVERPKKAIELYWRVRGIKNWKDMREGRH